MDGIVSAIRTHFAPRVAADQIIRHADLSLATRPEMSWSAKVAVNVMDTLHLNTLPLFNKLYDYFKQPSYEPKELELLATLGCKVAMAAKTIKEDITLNERRLNIELGEKNNIYSTLCFIERKDRDNAEKSCLFVKDYTGVEKPCPERFSTLEDIVAFYKEDVAANTDGVYSQHVSKDLFIDSTLGVALRHYGSDHFDEHDLTNFKKYVGLGQDYRVVLKDLQNRALRVNDEGHFSEKEVDLLLQFVKNQLRHSANWDLGITGQEFIMTIDGHPTLQDIHRIITRPIRTKVEEEAYNYIRARMNVGLETQRDLVEMACIYAVAEASLTLEQQKISRANRRDDHVGECIIANRTSKNTLEQIFGDKEPDISKYYPCRRAIVNSSSVSAPGVSLERAENVNAVMLYHAINCCFSALSLNNYNQRQFAIRDPAQV